MSLKHGFILASLARKNQNPFWDLLSALGDPENNKRSVFDEADQEVETKPLGPLPDQVEPGKVPLMFWPDEGYYTLL